MPSDRLEGVALVTGGRAGSAPRSRASSPMPACGSRASPGLLLSPGLVRTLAGRCLHAEHDDIEELIARADEIVTNDFNAIRLRR